MPVQILRGSRREPASDAGRSGGAGGAIRRRDSNRSVASFTPYARPNHDADGHALLTRAWSETRAACGADGGRPVGRTASLTAPTGRNAASTTSTPRARTASTASGDASVHLDRLSSAVLRAGLACIEAHDAGDRMDTDSDSDADDAVVPPSFSRMISAALARPAGTPEAAEQVAYWNRAPILDASCADLTRVAPRPPRREDEAEAMLQREAANTLTYGSGEMVESDIRRLVAESACAALQARFPRPKDICPLAIRKLRSFIRTFADQGLRTDAMQVMNARIDPLNGFGFARDQVVYASISHACGRVGLRDLAMLVWVAIQEAPVDSDKRAELRSLLLYNLADCARDGGFVCSNGAFQRLLAPLDSVYPGVRTMQRTPYEVVSRVSLEWRRAMAQGKRRDTPEDWEAFEQACMQQAEAYFDRDTPLYSVIEQQLKSSIMTCRAALAPDID